MRRAVVGKRKSLTLAWRRSMSSIRKTSERPSPAYNLSGTEAATAATPTEAAEAATEAAEAVIEAAAAEVAEAAEAALRFGGVAAAVEAAGGGAIE